MKIMKYAALSFLLLGGLGFIGCDTSTPEKSAVEKLANATWKIQSATENGVAMTSIDNFRLQFELDSKNMPDTYTITNTDNIARPDYNAEGVAGGTWAFNEATKKITFTPSRNGAKSFDVQITDANVSETTLTLSWVVPSCTDPASDLGCDKTTPAYVYVMIPVK